MSIEGIRKGYLFCQKRYVKGKGRWGGKVGGPSSYNTLLSAPLAHWAIITSPSEKLFVLLLLFIVTFYAFRFFSYSIGMHPFLHLSPVSARSINSHVTRHMSALDQLKHSCTINRGGSSFPVRW